MDDHVRRTGVHGDPAIDEQFRKALAAATFDADAVHGPAYVIRTGESELIREVDADSFAGQRAETRDLLASVGVGSVLVAPLKARTQTVGALTLARREPGRYHEADVPWVEDLGHRIGLAVENARLYADARELFEQTVSANFVSTPAGRILACNQTFAALLGLDSVDEARASDARSFYTDPEHRAHFLAELQDAPPPGGVRGDDPPPRWTVGVGFGERHRDVQRARRTDEDHRLPRRSQRRSRRSRSSCARRSGSKRSASSRAASRTTSTIC